MDPLTCPICHQTEGNTPLRAREMMFGTREVFSYTQCIHCGCWSLQQPPADMSPYYPANYYSFHLRSPLSPVRAFLKSHMGRAVLGKKDLLGTYLNKKLGPPFDANWFTKTGTKTSDSILDVGCGNGVLLLHLQLAGCSQLTGCEPYLNADITYPHNLTIHKKDISEMEGAYDLIMFHHVFEHLGNPLETLRHVYRLLRPGHFAIIRIPVADSLAAETYGTNWVQLDAPRHLYLHTKNSMALLAKEAGLEVRDVVHDSNGFQFWGSEQYVQDIPLYDPRSFYQGRSHELFTKEQIADYEHRAQKLNTEGRGDAAAFYLYRP